MKMKKTDIGVVVFMYAVCAFFYAYIPAVCWGPLPV